MSPLVNPDRPTNQNQWQPPQIYDLAQAADREAVDRLVADPTVAVYDQIHLAFEELYDIEHPAQKDTHTPADVEQFVQKLTGGQVDEYGRWVYFPWSKSLVHFPIIEHLRALRTSRNRNLVNAEEQQKLFGGKIVILGLSVGSNVTEALLQQGIGQTYVIVDNDVLEPSNLNRIRASYPQLGLHKVDVVAQRISELDPYVEQVHYRDGIREDNLQQVIGQNAPSIIVDEMDDLRMKILLRQYAKSARIPVVMATDDGDDILIDIERFDKEPELPILHGILPPEIVEAVVEHNKQFSRAEAGKIIGNYFVGLENVPLRMLESLMEVGKSLPSWPQLGGAATLAGIVVAYCSKKILLDQPLRSGRYLLGPDGVLNPALETATYKAALQSIIDKIRQNS